MAQLGELPLANLAAVRLDAQVDPGVLGQVRGVRERLRALGAFVRLRLAHVDLRVELQVRLATEDLVVVVRGGRRGRRVHAGRVIADRGSATGGGALAPRRAQVWDGRVIVLQSGGYHPRRHHGTILHRTHLHHALPPLLQRVPPLHLVVAVVVLLSPVILTIACPSSWPSPFSPSSYRRKNIPTKNPVEREEDRVPDLESVFDFAPEASAATLPDAPFHRDHPHHSTKR